MMLSTLIATIYFPIIPLLVLSDIFSVSVQDTNLTVTVYAILQAVSPGIFASLVDSPGRRPVLLGLTAVYVCASQGFALLCSAHILRETSPRTDHWEPLSSSIS